MKNKLNYNFLEKLYLTYNKPEFIATDPIILLHKYKWNPEELEVVGLITSAIAVGKVTQILKSVENILQKMDYTPVDFLRNSSEKEIMKSFKDFKHRFFSNIHIGYFLLSIKQIINNFESIKNAFLNSPKIHNDTVSEALEDFVELFDTRCANLIPNPKNGSACKRLFLYLRWMTRQDEIDFGLWQNISPSQLIIPLDVHMFKIGKKFGIISQNSANLKAAKILTNFFKKINPDDPVKYDFALTRASMKGAI